MRKIVNLGIVACLLLAFQITASAVQSVTLAWSPSADTNVIGYNIYYGVASRTYTNRIDVGNVLTCTVSNLMEGVTYFFAATAYNILGMESDYSNECSYSVPTVRVNAPPTLNAIGDVVIKQNDALQTVVLSGISSGSTNEVQTLIIFATSSNTNLIPQPWVNYVSPNSTGTLTFTPVTNASGTAVITVTVNDGGVTNNMATRTFMVMVKAPPTAPSNLRTTP